MSVKVRIPTPLRRLTQGKDEVVVEGKTIADVIDNIENNYAGIKERICDENGKVRRFVNIYLNDEDIRFIKDINTEVKDGDEISIVPAIAGGVSRVSKIKKTKKIKKIETKKVYLTYPQKLIKEPLIYYLGQKFKIITNIRGASVSDELGLVALELQGEIGEIIKGLNWIKSQGVKVEPIEQDIVE